MKEKQRSQRFIVYTMARNKYKVPHSINLREASFGKE